MTLTTGMLIAGKMSIGMERIETTPRTGINSARTTKVYGRRSASRTIHICVRFGRVEGEKGHDLGCWPDGPCGRDSHVTGAAAPASKQTSEAAPSTVRRRT